MENNTWKRETWRKLKIKFNSSLLKDSDIRKVCENEDLGRVELDNIEFEKAVRLPGRNIRQEVDVIFVNEETSKVERDILESSEFS